MDVIFDVDVERWGWMGRARDEMGMRRVGSGKWEVEADERLLSWTH